MASTFNVNLARGLMIGDGFRKIVAGVTGPASYVTAGEAITPGTFKLGVIEYWPDAWLVNAAATAIVLARYNYTSTKLQYFWGSGGGGEFSYQPSDLLGATTVVANSSTVDQNAAPVNAATIAAAATFTASAGVLTVARSPDIGRSVTITVLNDSGGNLNLYEGVTTYTVVGTFRGAAQTETILFTSTAGNKAVVTAKFRFKQGVKPFDTVTAITYDNAADGGLKVEAGLGSLIGLPVNRATPADADVLNFSITGVPRTVAGNFSDTNKTAEVGTTADAWDLQLLYLSGGGASAGAEVANATDLSGYTGRTLVHGR